MQTLLARLPARRQLRNSRGARVLVAIVAVVAFALGGAWLVRGIEHNHIVDRGPGLLSGPFRDCSHRGGRFGSHTCLEDVHLRISAGGDTMTLRSVDGLYATLLSRPAQLLPVDHVYYDTTNSEVDKITYGATTYQVETTRHTFLVLGIVMLAVGLVLLGLFAYLMGAARRRRF